MDFLIQAFSVFLMLAILSVLIVVHECGHFLVARLFGFQTPIFGIGLPFGGYITLGKAWDTEFRIYACLLGGFVLIPELGDESTLDPAIYSTESQDQDSSSSVNESSDLSNKSSNESGAAEKMSAIGQSVESIESVGESLDESLDESLGVPATSREAEGASTSAVPEKTQPDNAFGVHLKPFKKFPIWQRALVAVAGVTFNVLFAYLIMFSMLFFLGVSQQQVMIQRTVSENPIAQNAGVKAEDFLVGIDDIKVESTDDAIKYLSARPATEVVIHLLRQEKPVDLTLTTSSQGTVGIVLMPGGPTTYKKLDVGFFELAGIAYQKLWDLTANMMTALGQLGQGIWANVTGAKKAVGTPSVGFGDVHGVLAVIKIGADIARQDWSQLFLFTILISMDLAIINLFPYPALDGGHLAFMTLEAIRGRPMGERAHGEIIKWGFISLLVLMAVIMVNDVTALVTGKLDLRKKDKQESKIDKESLDKPVLKPVKETN
ncbi:MAG: site-2 protease family protein [Candidatus Obscuribacterales bacterium]|nr:site-2 protease family protein [Candidatus Obscuribacterales bacterium]